MARSVVRSLRGLTLAVALFLVGTAAPAQEVGRGAILGRVTDAHTGRPIVGATVTAANGAARTLTASDGIFCLAPLPPGRHTVTATHGGYEPSSVAEAPSPSTETPATTRPPILLGLRSVGQTGDPRARHEPAASGGSRRVPWHLEARVRWESADTANRFVVVEIHRYPGARPRQRAPELSEEQMLVVATAAGAPRDGSLIPDPGVLRAEAPGADGVLTGETRRLSETEFLVTLAAEPGIDELRFYRPRWTGALFGLDLLGAARLPALPAILEARPGALTPHPDR